MNKKIIILIITGFVLIIAFFTSRHFFVSPEEKIYSSEQEKNTPVPLGTGALLSLGIYEVCADVDGCDVENGIEKIKEAGVGSVIITVVDEDELESLAYYPSDYLPMAEYISKGYLEKVVSLVHQNNIKVYASINIPHNYWLKSHPDWIAVWSNGAKGDFYEDDYFHRIVPPSRLISEPECLSLLNNIIKEVISLGVDGIDINDNFQFSDQYLEESDETIFSSFDDFTIDKFEKDTGLAVRAEPAQQKADFIYSNPSVYQAWLEWRAEQVSRLIEILKGFVKEADPNVVFRPHLLTYGDPYQYYGIDYGAIAKQVDVMYLMITLEQAQEKYFEVINSGKSAGAKKIAVSTYLFDEEDFSVPEKDKEKILKRVEWIKQAGADEIYFYDFALIEQINFWQTLTDFKK